MISFFGSPLVRHEVHFLTASFGLVLALWVMYTGRPDKLHCMAVAMESVISMRYHYMWFRHNVFCDDSYRLGMVARCLSNFARTEGKNFIVWLAPMCFFALRNGDLATCEVMIYVLSMLSFKENLVLWMLSTINSSFYYIIFYSYIGS